MGRFDGCVVERLEPPWKRSYPRPSSILLGVGQSTQTTIYGNTNNLLVERRDVVHRRK